MREGLITAICTEKGWDPEDSETRETVEAMIDEQLEREAVKRMQALKVVAQFTRGLTTVNEMYEKLGEIVR